MHDDSFDPTDYLSNADPVMRRLIEEVGPFMLRPRIRRSPFESLARALPINNSTTKPPRAFSNDSSRSSPAVGSRCRMNRLP